MPYFPKGGECNAFLFGDVERAYRTSAKQHVWLTLSSIQLRQGSPSACAFLLFADV